MIRDLFGLHHQVGGIRTLVGFFMERIGLEQIEHLQDRETLGRRRRLKNGDVAIRALNRFTPARRLRR